MLYAQTMAMGIIAVHGGLDTSREKQYMEILQEAALQGHELLSKNRIQALEAVLRVLEESSKFNCGYGSVLNFDGVVEMDAAIIDGVSNRFAAVAAIQDVEHPISVARALLEKTSNVILAGAGAVKFARKQGFPTANCVSKEQREAWRQARESLARGEKPAQNLYTGLAYYADTVGCVVWDGEGLAAASSTGGYSLKTPGRVGDTPSLGGGIFASKTCAVVCTGIGETFIETLTAKYVDEVIAGGSEPQQAVKSALKRLHKLKKAEGGILAVNARGMVGAAFNAGRFPVVVVADGKLLDHYQPVNLTQELSVH
ncbi:MAG: isoaspartyl peptidase/L-asparaginase family protein [Desulfotomaculaceae bacterium]|nr:isoaspartyl peptidase/L-asparaginase family protein [Desulfotomaculaceae bacterium]